MKYRYTVINPENRQLTGTISATDEKSAREELNQLGFSIVKIEEISESEEAENQEKTLAKFEFTATDKNMKRVGGTIQAENRYSAYKRLVKEYLFEVDYLVDLGLAEEEKKTQRQKGIYELQNKLDQEELLEKKKKPKEEFDFEEFAKKQQILQSQVSFVLEKVNALLNLYESEMKAETKGKIHSMVDKILRIKSSTNLDYIRKSCEELLNFLQKEELFLHENLKQKEHAKMAMEAKTMMMQLHEKGPSFEMNLFEKLKEWRREHITANEDPTAPDLFLNFLLGILIGFHDDTPEIETIKKSIKNTNHELKQYLSIYLQASNENMKTEARSALKKLWLQRKMLVKKLTETKKTQKAELKNRQEYTLAEKLSNEILSFSGLLLTFYLCYYFTSIYLAYKDFGIENIPATLSIYSSMFLKYFVAVLFLFHSSLSIKINFFRRNEFATVIITPLFLLAAFIIVLNF